MTRWRWASTWGRRTAASPLMVDGKPTVIPNEWGERTHASVVSFLEDGTVLVGNAAKKNIITNAENTVYSAKRLIGRFYFSDEVKKAQAVMPYQIVEGAEQLGAHPRWRPGALAARDLRPGAARDEGHRRELPGPRGHQGGGHRPRLLQRQPAPGHQGRRPHRRPGGAAHRQRAHRRRAGLRLRPGRARRRSSIYDLGGGTFDVSILEIGKDVFEVLSTAGDTYLGGDDFDDRIMTWLADDFQAEHRPRPAPEQATACRCSRRPARRPRSTWAATAPPRSTSPGICQDPDGQGHGPRADPARPTSSTAW